MFIILDKPNKKSMLGEHAFLLVSVGLTKVYVLEEGTKHVRGHAWFRSYLGDNYNVMMLVKSCYFSGTVCFVPKVVKR